MTEFVKSIEIVEKKSKFLGYLLLCQNENDIKRALEFLKTEHKKATHICWAARLEKPFFEKAVDDGEPSGTAGRPILNVLQKKISKMGLSLWFAILVVSNLVRADLSELTAKWRENL